MRREPFERALERCTTDPQFESRLRSVYRGRHDVLDALWWAAHPLTSSPRGVPDPAAELRALQNAVFSRERGESPILDVTDPGTGAPVRMREDEHRLREAQHLLAADAAHLDAALDAVNPADAPSAAPAPAEARYVAPAGRLERDAAAAPQAAPPPVVFDLDQPAQQEHGVIPGPSGAVARARKLLLPVLSGAALLAAVVFLPSISGMNTGTGGAQTPSPTFTQTPRITTEIVTLGSDGNVPEPLRILERPQTETDLPPDGFPVNATDSYRKLPDLVGHVQLYLDRDGKATICLVAVRDDGNGMRGCTDESQFIEHGIWLGGGERYSIGEDTTILTESFSLLANGDFHYEATARVRQPD